MSDVLQGMWHQAKGKVKEVWGDLTDDEITEIDGRRENLSGKLQERYGWAKADAEERIDRFIDDNRV